MSLLLWLRQATKHESAGGLVLILAMLLALLMANSVLKGLYQGVLAVPVVVQIGAFEIAKPLLLWINDGLMALFFFLIGLEIKRELIEGQLSSLDQVILPACAAIAGIAMPAIIYVALTYDDPIAVNGWAIPSATDIAFALGIFSLFGSRVPISLKLFLLSVAIFDDISAIIIIALFYSQDLSTVSLMIAGSGIGTLLLMNRLSVYKLAPYVLVGLVVWAAVLKSGVHATLAGFAVALFIPLKPNPAEANSGSLLHHVEHSLHPWVAFLVIPIFAFANAGVYLMDATWDDVANPISLGIILGLFIGKQVGIFGISWLAIKCGLARMPKGASWLQLYGVSLLCGVGFTMSLFIGTLAFEQQGMGYQDSVKIGVLIGSLLSAVIGGFILYRSQQPIVEGRYEQVAAKKGG